MLKISWQFTTNTIQFAELVQKSNSFTTPGHTHTHTHKQHTRGKGRGRGKEKNERKPFDNKIKGIKENGELLKALYGLII